MNWVGWVVLRVGWVVFRVGWVVFELIAEQIYRPVDG